MGGQTEIYLSASVLFSILAKSRGVVHVPSPANPSAVTCAKSKASRLFGVDIITELRG